MVCRSVRFDIINLLTDFEQHLQHVPGSLSSLEYFYSKHAVLELPLLWTGLQLAQGLLGNKQDPLHELNWLDLCVREKIVWLLCLICLSGIKDVRRMRRDGSVTSNSQITEICCVLKIIVIFVCGRGFQRKFIPSLGFDDHAPGCWISAICTERRCAISYLINTFKTFLNHKWEMIPLPWVDINAILFTASLSFSNCNIYCVGPPHNIF